MGCKGFGWIVGTQEEEELGSDSVCNLVELKI